MLRFFYGPSAAAGRHLLDECLRRLALPRQSFIYVVPTARRARSLEKQILELRPQGFFRPHLLTFYSLVHLLHRKMGGTGVPISPAVKAILLEEIVGDTTLNLSYFARREGKPFPGLIAKLAAFISDLKQNLIDPGQLERRTQAVERPASAKSRELVKIYRQYQTLLDKHRLIDTDGMFWLVLNELSKPGKLAESLDGIDLLIFDGFFDLTHAEGEVLAKLIQQAPNVWLRLDYVPGSAAFAAAEGFVQQFCGTAERIAVPPTAGSPAERIVPGLFDPAQPPAAASPGEPPAISLLECRDRLAEVEAIAAEIKAMAAAPGFRPNRAAVAFKNLPAYAPLIREVFPACGIHFNSSSGRPLSESPVTATLMSILEIISDDYSRVAVLKFLRSPYVQFSFEHEGNSRVLDGDFLDTEARVARIFRGKDSWWARLSASADQLEHEIALGECDNELRARARLARLREQATGIKLALDEISRLDTGGCDQGGRRPPLQPDAEGGHAEGGCHPPLQAVGAHGVCPPGVCPPPPGMSPPGAHTPKAFGQAFYGLIHRFGIARGLFFAREGPTDDDVLERDYRAMNAFQKLLDDLIFAAGFSGRQAFDFAEYVEMIEAGLGGASFDVRRDVGYGVQVMSADELRGGDYDVVFLGGMAEGEFPRPAGPQIFFSERRRRDLGFKCDPPNLAIERYLFSTVVAAPTRRLVVSYPRSENGAVLLRSLFVSEIERLIPAVPKLPRPEPPAVFSHKTLQHCLGSALSGRDEARARAAAEIAAQLPADSLPTLLFRTLAIEEMRRRGGRWTEFEGALADPRVKDMIAAKYRESAFTVSNLERYAQCPFKFFAEQVAKLVELEEPQEEIDALERGGLLHRILGTFYMQRRAGGKVHLDEQDDRAAALAHIVQVASDEFARLPFEGLFWEMERERIAGTRADRGSRSVLEMFIDTEMSCRGTCKPRFFEVTFGHRRADELTDSEFDLPELVLADGGGRVRISGRIDRIEAVASRGQNLAVVVDYKTGAPPGSDQIRGHLSLQLPVYMLALRNDPKQRLEPIGGAFYCLKDDPEKFGKCFFGDGPRLRECCGLTGRKAAGMLDEQEFAGFLQASREKLMGYADAIRRGDFHPSTLAGREAGCQYCIFNSVCRRYEAKTARMAEQEAGNA